MAVHSQDMNIPDCPRGWDSLWMGYSFAMVSQILLPCFKDIFIPHKVQTLKNNLKEEDFYLA